MDNKDILVAVLVLETEAKGDVKSEGTTPRVNTHRYNEGWERTFGGTQARARDPQQMN